MRFARQVAATAGVLVVASLGLYGLTPAHQQQIDQDRSPIRDLRRQVAFFNGDGPQIGLSVRDVEPADITRQKLADEVGAVVDEVRSQTPAAKAGIKAGDIVVSYDGERVRSARQLERLVDETPAGRTVKLSVIRGGARVDLDVTPEAAAAASAFESDALARLAERGARVNGPRVDVMPPDLYNPRLGGSGAFRFSGPMDFEEGDGPFGMMFGRSRLGVRIDTVDGQLAKYFGVDNGVLVRDVTEDSPAARAGLEAGDVITAVNGKPTRDTQDLRRALNDVENGKSVTLTVTRDRKPLTLTATLESPESTRARVRRII